MRYFNQQGEEITVENIDLATGEILYVLCGKDEPWENNKQYEGELEEVGVYVPFPKDSLYLDRIGTLRQQLADTDYVTIKIAEGAASREEYADILSDRASWRAEINELEALIEALENESEAR